MKNTVGYPYQPRPKSKAAILESSIMADYSPANMERMANSRSAHNRIDESEFICPNSKPMLPKAVPRET